jgi:hypothetical protein
MASRTIRRRAGLRTFVQLDEVAQLIRRAHGEAGLSGGDAMAAAEAAGARTATSRKGKGSVSAKDPRRRFQAARSPDKGRAHPPPSRPRDVWRSPGHARRPFTLAEVAAWSKASSATARAGALLREGARVRHNKQRLLTRVSSRC